MPNLSPTALELLQHLNVHLYDTWEIDPWGDPEDAVHVFAPPALVGQVSDFFTNRPQGYRVRVFEGPPPPF